MKSIRSIKYLMIFAFALVLTFVMLVPSNVFAASASLNTSLTTMEVGEKANISASVASTEAWNLKLTANGGNLSGTTESADAEGSEVSKNILSASFTSDKAGTYTVTLSGNITGSDLVKQTVSKTVTIKVIEKVQETPTETEKPTNTPSTPTPDSKPTQEPTKKSNDASIKTLAAQADGKKVEVSQNATKYTATVEANVKAVTFTITTGSTKATIDSNKNTTGIGFAKNSETSGSKTYTISNLKEGNNVIAITVKAEDGTSKNYTFTVTKKVAENNINEKQETTPNIDTTVDSTPTEEPKEEEVNEDVLGLKNLVVTGTQISPAFSINTFEYTAKITDADSVEIIAIPTFEDATVEVLGNTNLVVGENLITVMVKKDNEVKTYQIILTKGEEEVAATDSSSIDLDEKLIFGLTWKHLAIIGAGLLILIAIVIRLVGMSKKPVDDYGRDVDDDNRYEKRGRRYK